MLKNSLWLGGRSPDKNRLPWRGRTVVKGLLKDNHELQNVWNWKFPLALLLYISFSRVYVDIKSFSTTYVRCHLNEKTSETVSVYEHKSSAEKAYGPSPLSSSIHHRHHLHHHHHPLHQNRHYQHHHHHRHHHLRFINNNNNSGFGQQFKVIMAPSTSANGFDS